MSTIIKLDGTANAHIQAYWEYKNIVGDTDGGKLLSEEEYAKRRKQAFENQKNRVYVTWLNENNLECRAVGPSSKCFCGHKFRDHDTCNKQKKVSCKMAKCKCKLFEYIPIRGSQDLKCHCKHSYKLHNITTRKCNKKHPVKGLCHCHGFVSSFGCPCAQPFSAHYTLFETRKERQKAGKRVDNLGMGTGMGCAALGGITTFSSLLDGVDRVPQNNPQISDLQMQFIRPKQKLTEEEEMALYARKYEKKSSYSDLQNQQQSLPQNQLCIEPENMNMRHRHSQPMQHQPISRNNQAMNMRNKLKLLKQRRRHSMPTNSNPINDIASNMQHLQIGNNHQYHQPQQRGQERKQQETDSYDFEMSEIDQRINQIEQELRDPYLSSAKKYALNKNLKMEKSKIIRYQRKRAQDKRRFEAGL